MLFSGATLSRHLWGKIYTIPGQCIFSEQENHTWCRNTSSNFSSGHVWPLNEFPHYILSHFAVPTRSYIYLYLWVWTEVTFLLSHIPDKHSHHRNQSYCFCPPLMKIYHFEPIRIAAQMHAQQDPELVLVYAMDAGQCKFFWQLRAVIWVVQVSFWLEIGALLNLLPSFLCIGCFPWEFFAEPHAVNQQCKDHTPSKSYRFLPVYLVGKKVHRKTSIGRHHSILRYHR